MRRLEQQGIPFRLFQCDVTDEASLASTLRQVRSECGPIVSVLHTAGLAGSGFLLDKNPETFESVMAPKLVGARLIDRLTRSDPVRHFVLASSRTALNGAAGQSDYAAANAALDCFAAWRTAKGRPTLSLGWTTWARIGMAARSGVGGAFALAPDRAADALLRALACRESYITMSLPGEPLTGESKGRTGKAPEQALAASLVGLSPEEAAKQAMEQVLGYAGKLTPEDDFYALGGDSLSGMRIVSALGEALGVAIGLADLLSCGRLKDFAARVRELAEGGRGRQPSAPAPALEEYPVSLEQLAVLRAETAASVRHTGYNLPQFVRLPVSCGVGQLRDALGQLVRRHEILRTAFVGLDQPEPHMRLMEPGTPKLSEYRFPSLEEAASELIRPFELETPPLYRAALLHVEKLPASTVPGCGPSAGEGRVLFFDIHHALADARGVGILLRDLHLLLGGTKLPPAGLQMKDAAWRQRREAGEALEQARAYWLSLYADGLPQTDFPADFPRPFRHTNRGAHAGFSLSRDLTDSLRKLAAARGMTLGSLLHAAWFLLCLAESGKDDLVIGLAADTRPSGFEQCAGMFASLLPVRLRGFRQLGVENFLLRVHKADTQAIAHAAFPLGSLLAELRPPLDLSRTTLAEVVFSYMNYGAAETSESLFNLENPACKADLSVFVSERQDGLLVTLEYYADLFSAEHMQTLGQRCVALLELLVTDCIELGVEKLLAQLPGRPADVRKPVSLAEDLPTESKHEGNGSTAVASEPAQEPVRIAEKLFCEFFSRKALAPEDTFFSLGGHSLLAMQMVNALRRRHGWKLRVSDLLAHPDPHGLGAFLASLPRDGSSSLAGDRSRAAPVSPHALYPLSHAQQRLYVQHNMGKADTAYNMVFLFVLASPLDAARLRKALDTLARRQDMLRTVLLEVDGELRQAVRDEALPACFLHVQPLPERDAVTCAAREIAAPYDLTKGMIRLSVRPTTEGGQCVALGMHHLAGDGWSMQILFGELLSLYADPSASLPPLPLQYREWALEQQNREWSAAVSYWREVLRDAPACLRLPAGGKASRCQEVIVRTVAPAVAERLRLFAVRGKFSLASCLLALLAALFFRLSRQDDLVIGMGVAGRERAELEGLIGFFVNMLPIRIRKPSDGSLETLLAAVQAACSGALAWQDYPFDLLVRQCLPRSEKQSGAQLFSVVFEYQRYSDLKNISTVKSGDVPPMRIVDEAEWLPLLGEAAPQPRFDLTVYAQDMPEGLLLRAEYDGGLFTRDDVAQWLVIWETLMARVSAACPAGGTSQNETRDSEKE